MDLASFVGISCTFRVKIIDKNLTKHLFSCSIPPQTFTNCSVTEVFFVNLYPVNFADLNDNHATYHVTDKCSHRKKAETEAKFKFPDFTV